MSRAPQETLDETIDRVAAAMTTVPADPEFSERLSPRLASGTMWTSRSLVFATAAAAIVLLAVMTTNRREPASRIQIAAVPIVDPVAAPPAVTSEDTAVVDAASTAMLVDRTERLEQPEQTEPASIAALVPPDSLTVEDLALHQLAVEPVEVERLAVPTLEISALGDTEGSKE